MEIEQAIRTYLMTQSALTDLVSTRVVPDVIKDGTAMPAVVYDKISDVKTHLLSGQSLVEQPRIQYTTFATSKSSAKSVMAVIKDILVDYSGTLSDIVIQHIKLIAELSDAEQSGDGAQKLFTEMLEFEITYER